MSRIAAQTPADFQFRGSDNTPTRAQKLEILRQALVGLLRIEDGGVPNHTHEIEQVIGLADILDGLRAGQTFYRVGGFLTDAALSNETVFQHIVTEDIEIPANFEGSKGSAGILPAAEMVFNIYKNPTFGITTFITGGAIIGTMTIDVDGTFTFATTGGAKQRLYLGDRIGIAAPATPDVMKNAEYTFRLIAGFAVATILLSGDATDGNDNIKLSGDAQETGLDVLLLSGDSIDG